MVKNQPPKRGLRTDCAFLGGQNRGLLVFLDEAKRAKKTGQKRAELWGSAVAKKPFPNHPGQEH